MCPNIEELEAIISSIFVTDAENFLYVTLVTTEPLQRHHQIPLNQRMYRKSNLKSEVEWEEKERMVEEIG